MSTTRDLFGYAGSSHQPQGRVLTAEEIYGALGSASLDAEEEYGDWDDDEDDEFGALDSESLFAEEAYGALDSRSLFEEEEYGYTDDDEYGEIEDDLDELDEEIDGDAYGAFYGAAGGVLRVPAGTEPTLRSLADAVAPGGVLLPGFLLSAGADPGWIELGLETLQRGLEGGDADELAAYLMNEPGFGNWNDPKTPRAAMVYNAVVASAIPGFEQNWDEPFRQAFENNDTRLGKAWGGVMATPEAIWALLTTDAPNAMVGWLKEAAPFLSGPLTEWAGASPDQMINVMAMRYYMIGLVYPEGYDWIADAVTRQGQDAIHAVAESDAAAAPRSSRDLGAVPASFPNLDDVLIAPPPQAIPSTGMGLPAPTTILAAGYGFVIGGSVLGILS